MLFNSIASVAASVVRLTPPLDAAALNPQPLPPRELGSSPLRRLNAVGLNPQPLPPREQGVSLLGRLHAVALNPQPLPPRALSLTSLLDQLDTAALNPQPLPPRESLSLSARIGVLADDFCGTVPRRPPHGPLPLGPLVR